VLAGADAVILGIGGFDHAPGGIPPSVEAVVPYLRPDGLRRRVRKALGAAYPWAVRATRFRLHRTPPAEFDRLFDLVLTQVRGLTRGAPGVVLGPTSHRSPYYGGRDPRFRTAEARQLAIAVRHGFPTASVWDRVEPHLDRLNVDGIHWPADVHAAVGRDAAAALIPQFRGEAPRPGLPTF
jgi:diglucosylglycerate octanoyltransferase